MNTFYVLTRWKLAVASKVLALPSVQIRKFHIDTHIENVIRHEIRERLNER